MMYKFFALTASIILLAGCGGRSRPVAAPSAGPAAATVPVVATQPLPTALPTPMLPAPTGASSTAPAAPVRAEQPATAVVPTAPAALPALQEFPVPPGSHPHDVAP